MAVFSFFMQSLPAFAGGYRIEISQVEPDGERRQSFCNKPFDKCHINLPVKAKGDESLSEMNIDLIFDADSMMLQFLWEGMYLYQRSEGKRLLRMDLPKGNVSQTIFVYVPTLQERRDDPSLAILRAPLQEVSTLSVLIEEMAP